MKIENVIKKFNGDDIYRCPKCSTNCKINNISLVCENNHSYDFSKKGYIHLIANYKPTKYSESLFSARKFVFSNGFYEHIAYEIASILKDYNLINVLDVGCGEGYYIKFLKNIFSNSYFYGIDNSKDAIECAVKDDKINPYMLANLSNLPFRDNCLDVILNILTPANYNEFFRVLKDDGILIKIIPTENYLKEIRQLLSSEYNNEDIINLIESNCKVISNKRVTKTFLLNEEEAENFLKMTPLTFSKNVSEDIIKKLKEITIELEIIVAVNKK